MSQHAKGAVRDAVSATIRLGDRGSVMKVMTILGTRPEIIRLSVVIPRLDETCEHCLVHTGQNFDPALSDVFFSDLNLRQPDHYLGIGGESFGEQIGQLFERVEKLMRAQRPGRVLILGDTNSALSAIIAKRLGIPVFHMEAGNRCYDDRVPEEVNRRLIDHASDILMPYTERSRDCLLREGIASNRIFVTGNPIREVLLRHTSQERDAELLGRLKIQRDGYLVATLHRAETVDRQAVLTEILRGLERVARDTTAPVVLSVHPRTKARLKEAGIAHIAGVQLHDPFGLADFVALMRNAKCVLTDSGTVQEECAILGVPNVTIRETTERPETLEGGSNILAGITTEDISRAVKVVLSGSRDWSVPREYLAENVSNTVVRIVLGFHRNLPNSATFRS